MHGPSLTADPILAVLVLMAAGLLAIGVSARTGLNGLLALIVVGALIGPSAIGLVRHGPTLELLGEIGIAFLLFDIGLHLSADTLWKARRYLFVFAPAQIGLCTLAFVAVGAAFPRLPSAPWLAAALSLSSTAVVLQLLRDRGEEQTPIGRAAVSALLAQDLFVVVLLVMLPALASGNDPAGPLAEAMVRLVAALIACVGIGRYALAPLFGRIGRLDRPEAFTAAALFFVLSIAWLSHAIGLSLALGAFLAGIALAESRYSYLVQSEVAPFRGLLLSLFFLSVGLSIELEAIVENLLEVASITTALVVTKTVVTTLAGRSVGLGWGCALRVGLLLAQGSEFMFVILVVAGGEGLIDPAASAPISAAIVVSIAATPALASLGRRLAERLDRIGAETPRTIPPRRVVLIGFDETLQRLARALDRTSIPVIAFTSDRERVMAGRAKGYDVHFGDPTRPSALALVSRGAAAALVVGLADDAHTRSLIESVDSMQLDVPIYAVASDPAGFEALRETAASEVVVRSPAAAERLAEALLSRLGSSSETVREAVVECGDRPGPVLGGALGT